MAYPDEESPVKADEKEIDRESAGDLSGYDEAVQDDVEVEEGADTDEAPAAEESMINTDTETAQKASFHPASGENSDDANPDDNTNS